MQQPRPPVVPPEPDPRLVRHEITELKFVQVGQNSRLWIKAPDDIDYRVVRVSATKLKLDLINAEIPKKYQQPLRTDQWSTAVDMVIPGSHTIFIQMKEAAPYKVEKKKGVLMVDFAPPRLELPKQKAAHAKTGAASQSGQGASVAPGANAAGNGEPVDCESSVDCLKSKIEELAVERDKKKKVLTTPSAEILDKPITMDFQDIRLKNAFRLLSEQAGINITLDPDVEGVTTLRLHDIPLRDAIDTILATNDLARVMVGDVIRVGKADKINKFIEENKAKVASIEQRIAAYRSKIKALEDRKKKEENPTPIEGSIRTDEIGEAGCIKIDEEEICFYYTTVKLTYAKPSDIQKILDCMFNMNCPGTAAGAGGAAQANVGATSVAEQKTQREKRIGEVTEKLQQQGFSPDSLGAASRLAEFEKLELERQHADAYTARTEAIRSSAGLGQLENKVNPREREIIANSMLWSDDASKMLFIKDTSDRIAQMKQVIKSLDTPIPQVMVESRLVRASREWARELGIRWGGRNNQNGQIDNNKKAFWGITGNQGGDTYAANTPTGTTLVPGGDIPSRFAINLPSPLINTVASPLSGLGMQFGLLGTQYVSELDVRLEIGEGNSQAKTIARPKVQVIDGEKAKIVDGRDVAYSTSSPLQGTQSQLIPAYLQLEVKPSIFADGRIKMELTVSDDEPVPSIIPTATQPDIYRRKANTFMIVRDGETAVIGGIVRESNIRRRQGLPGLMNIPLLSYLFGNKSQQKDLTELLVFITPTIIKRPPPAS
jgi:type IV pilus assembly protein PilQ